MNGQLAPYPIYKDSATPWLGQVPEHWDVLALRRYSRVFSGGTPSRAIAEYWNDGSIPWLASGDVNLRRIREARQFITEAGYAGSSAKWIRPGSLVIALAGQGRTKGMVATVEGRMTCNQSLAAIEPAPSQSDYRFLAYYIESRYLDIRSLVGDGLRDGLNLEHVRSIVTPLPPLAEQEAIVRFLDYADRRIQRYVVAKQNFIKLLEEQKRATLQNAVTRGLDSEVRFKPSGEEWIGDVPSHWDVVPNRALLKLRKELVGDASSDYTLLSLTKRGVIPRDLENPEGKFPASFDTYQAVQPGDLIFCLFDIDETPRAVGVAEAPGMVTGAYTRFECADPKALEYVYLFYLAMDNGKHLKPLYTGLRKAITKAAFLSAKVPLPPLKERQKIVEHIHSQTKQVDATVERAQRGMALLLQYRTRVIADVVTGKLDVREAAEKLPDESGEPEMVLRHLDPDVTAGELADLSENNPETELAGIEP